MGLIITFKMEETMHDTNKFNYNLSPPL